MTIAEIKAAYETGTFPRNLDALMAAQDKVDKYAQVGEEDPELMGRISDKIQEIIDELI